MKSSIAILTLISLFTISCSTNEDSLSRDPTLAASFNTDELEDLQRIYNWFNQEICETDEPGIALCYKDYLQSLENSLDPKTGSIDMDLDYSGLQEVLLQIDSSTFKEIWWIGWEKNRDSEEYKRRISLLPNGKYAQFLVNASNENPMIQKYAQIFITSGDIGPNLFAELLFEYERFNLSDIKARLLIALHYATFLDNAERNETIAPPKDALPIGNETPLTSSTQEGEYELSIWFAEWGTDSEAKAKLEIRDGIAVVYYVSGNLSNIVSGEVMTTGRLMQHQSGQWIITHNANDVYLPEVGGCTDGPFVVDLDQLIFWIC